MEAAIVILVMAIIIGSTLSYFGGQARTIGMAIAFWLFCLSLIVVLVGVLITA